MRKLPLGINNERRLKALTGLNYEKYEKLLTVFGQIIAAEQAKISATKKRKRAVGGGRKPALPTVELKLLFVLYYLKAYPTFDLLGDRFGMSTATANIQLYQLVPFLQSSLEVLAVLPKRSFNNAQAFKAHIENHGGLAEILIDATERPYYRYQDTDKRNAMYSGKKKDIQSRTP